MFMMTHNSDTALIIQGVLVVLVVIVVAVIIKRRKG